MVKNRTGVGSIYAGDTSKEAVERREKRILKKLANKHKITKKAQKKIAAKKVKKREKKHKYGKVGVPPKPKFLNPDGSIDYSYHSNKK